MIANELNKRITLQFVSGSTMVNGLDEPTWVDGATVWAAAEPLKGREFFEAQAAQSEITMKFRIRYVADLKSKKFRVKYGTYTDASGVIKPRCWDIVSVIDSEERHRELHLMAKVVE